MMKADDIRLTLLFDNYPNHEALQTLWGFSCYIETPRQTILFDTGSNGKVLLDNMRILGKPVEAIDTIFLSHHHWDHTGGLDSVTELNPDVRIIAPSCMSKLWIQDLRTQVAEVTVVDTAPVLLDSHIGTTGMMGDETPEQTLILDTTAGLVVVTGCAHSGITTIAKKAMALFDKEIALLIGGFHLMRSNASEIAHVVNELAALPIRRICPTHCSGDDAIRLFREKMPDRYIRGGVGTTMSL